MTTSRCCLNGSCLKLLDLKKHSSVVVHITKAEVKDGRTNVLKCKKERLKSELKII